MKKINIILFVGILMVLGVMNLFYTVEGTVLEDENRTIKKPIFTFDNLFSGDYFRDYDVYFSDTFIFRNQFIALSSSVGQMKGFTTDSDAEIISTSAINVGNRISERPDDDENVDPTKPIEEGIEVTKLGKILVVDNKAMEIHHRNEEAEVGYPDAINYIAERIDSNVYSMLVPTRIEFTEKIEYKDISYPQIDTIHAINSRFMDKIVPVDVYSYMEAASDQYIYMKTDHHWTAIGAYQAYKAFMDQLGMEYLPLDAFEAYEFEGYLGSLWRVSQSEKLEKNPDSIFAFLPVVETEYSKVKAGLWTKGEVVDIKYFDPEYTTNHYGVYLQGDSSLSVIKSDVETDRTLLILKDSYANSFIPFLTSHFKEIHIIDPRLYEENVIDYINEKQIDDVLFLNYVLVNRYMGYTELYRNISGQDSE